MNLQGCQGAAEEAWKIRTRTTGSIGSLRETDLLSGCCLIVLKEKLAGPHSFHNVAMRALPLPRLQPALQGALRSIIISMQLKLTFIT